MIDEAELFISHDIIFFNLIRQRERALRTETGQDYNRKAMSYIFLSIK